MLILHKLSLNKCLILAEYRMFLQLHRIQCLIRVTAILKRKHE